MPGTLGGLLGLFLAVPFVALTDWFQFIKRLPPGEQQLAKAAHGMGMLALVAYWIDLTGGFATFLAAALRNPCSPFCWVPAGMAAWGVGWFWLNARFAAVMVGPPARGTIIVRGILKLALGGAIWIYAGRFDLGGFLLIPHAVAMWCFATGATKILLLWWGGGNTAAYPIIEGNIRDSEFDWD